MALKYSVTTVMLPHLDLPDTCQLLQRLGYAGIELRVRTYTGDLAAAPSPWGRHVTDVSPDNVVARAAEIRQVVADHGLTLCSFAANANSTDLGTVEKLAAGAQATGCPRLRIGTSVSYDGKTNYWTLYDQAVRAYEAALVVTRRHGIRALVEIHGGGIVVSASLAHRLVSNFDPADIGVIYDPQNMVLDGWETTALALDLLGDYVAHLHIGGHKYVAGTPDANGTTPWTAPGCPMGEGRFNYPHLLDELHRRQFSGYISVEDFDSTRPAEARCADAMDYLRRIDPSRPAATV